MPRIIFNNEEEKTFSLVELIFLRLKNSNQFQSGLNSSLAGDFLVEIVAKWISKKKPDLHV